MNELRRFVMRYIVSEIDLAAFRAAFLKDFLTVQSTDPSVWQAVLEIESECGDFSEGLIASEAELKYQISKTVQPFRQVVGSAAVLLLDFEAQMPVCAASGPDASGRNFSSFPNLAQTDLRFVGAA